MRAFFIMGRNILFRIRRYIDGGICPSWCDSSGAYAHYAPRLDTPLFWKFSSSLRSNNYNYLLFSYLIYSFLLKDFTLYCPLNDMIFCRSKMTLYLLKMLCLFVGSSRSFFFILVIFKKFWYKKFHLCTFECNGSAFCASIKKHT